MVTLDGHATTVADRRIRPANVLLTAGRHAIASTATVASRGPALPAAGLRDPDSPAWEVTELIGHARQGPVTEAVQGHEVAAQVVSSVRAGWRGSVVEVVVTRAK
jgi:hypothetical protein